MNYARRCLALFDPVRTFPYIYKYQAPPDVAFFMDHLRIWELFHKLVYIHS